MTESQYNEFLKVGRLEKPLRAFLVDTYGVTEEGTGLVVIEDSLDELHRVLDCDAIDIAVRDINGVECDIIIDDNGFFRNGARVGAVFDGLHDCLFGNLLICSHDDEGELRDITEEQARAVMESLYMKKS